MSEKSFLSKTLIHNIVLYSHRFLIPLPLAHYFPFSGFVNICLFFPSNVTKKTKPTQEQLTLNTKCGRNVSLRRIYFFCFSLVHLIALVYKSNIGFLIVICLIISYYKDNNYPLFHYWKILLTQPMQYPYIHIIVALKKFLNKHSETYYAYKYVN